MAVDDRFAGWKWIPLFRDAAAINASGGAGRSRHDSRQSGAAL
jgi:hypothetical protein